MSDDERGPLILVAALVLSAMAGGLALVAWIVWKVI